MPCFAASKSDCPGGDLAPQTVCCFDFYSPTAAPWKYSWIANRSRARGLCADLPSGEDPIALALHWSVCAGNVGEFA